MVIEEVNALFKNTRNLYAKVNADCANANNPARSDHKLHDYASVSGEDNFTLKRYFQGFQYFSMRCAIYLNSILPFS